MSLMARVAVVVGQAFRLPRGFAGESRFVRSLTEMKS